LSGERSTKNWTLRITALPPQSPCPHTRYARNCTLVKEEWIDRFRLDTDIEDSSEDEQ
jgi:hypothetical protein